jgi:hypothetical protein
LNISPFLLENSQLFYQVAQQTANEDGTNILSNMPVNGQGPAVVTESTNFPPEGLGPDFAQAFSDQPFQVASSTEQQEQEESTFAQNTLVHTLTSGKYVVCMILQVICTYFTQ